jgi:hypothetical protein
MRVRYKKCYTLLSPTGLILLEQCWVMMLSPQTLFYRKTVVFMLGYDGAYETSVLARRDKHQSGSFWFRYWNLFTFDLVTECAVEG